MSDDEKHFSDDDFVLVDDFNSPLPTPFASEEKANELKALSSSGAVDDREDDKEEEFSAIPSLLAASVDPEKQHQRSWFLQLEGVLELYRQDRLFECMSLLAELLPNPRMSVEERERYQHLLDSNHAVSIIIQQYSDVKHVLFQLSDEEGWDHVRQEGTTSVSRKHELDTPIHSIKVVGDVDAGMLDVASIIHEMQIVPSLMPMEIQVRQLHRVSRLTQLLYLRVKMPWPFDDRDAVFLCQGFDMLEEGKIVFLGRSIDDASELDIEEDIEIPPTPSDCTRLVIRQFGACLSPSSDGSKTHVRAIMNFDLHINSLPNSLLNYMARNLAFKGFERFQNEVPRLFAEGLCGEAVVSDMKLFGDLKTRFDEFLASRALAIAEAPDQRQALSVNTENRNSNNNSRSVRSNSKSVAGESDDGARKTSPSSPAISSTSSAAPGEVVMVPSDVDHLFVLENEMSVRSFETPVLREYFQGNANSPFRPPPPPGPPPNRGVRGFKPPPPAGPPPKRV